MTAIRLKARKTHKKEDDSFRGSMVENRSFGSKLGDALIILVLALAAFICVIPIWHVMMSSVSNGQQLFAHKGMVVTPVGDLNLGGYELLFRDTSVMMGYLNTIIYVVAGTALNLAVTMPAAYALSRPDFRARNVVMTYFVFTMYFSGGLVPLYMTISNLGLISTKLILIIFVAVNTYNLIIARTFIQNSIPNDLYEAAILDGCDHFTYFWKVVIPLSKAVISVEILYYGVFHWNDYFNALVYNYKQSNEPLQMVLRRILLLNEAYASGNGGVQGGYGQSSADQVKYAVMIVSTVPILCVYPFVQKYFEKGVMIGAVKG